MHPRFLLDTHILIRWVGEPKRLSREQTRILNEVTGRCEPFAISAITLVELAVLSTSASVRLKLSPNEIFSALESAPDLRILPVTIDIAREVSFLGNKLRDPADCVIVATARVHGLRLLTSDQRIIESNTVASIE